MSGTRRKPGAMGPYIGGFEERLLDLGYAPDTVRNMLKHVGQLGRWMSRAGLQASQLSTESTAGFVSAYRAVRPASSAKRAQFRSSARLSSLRRGVGSSRGGGAGTCRGGDR